MRRNLIFLLSWSVFIIMNACNQKEKADLIVTSG